MPHLLLGNALFFLFLALGASDLISWWLILVALVVVLFIFFRYDPSNDMKQQYRDARLREIRACFQSDKEALDHIEREIPQTLNTSPSVDVIALPTALATIVVTPFVFADIANSLNWFWLLRWIVAGAGAFILWVLFFALWAVANMTPARLRAGYLEIRREEEEASKFGAEDQNDIHIIRQITNLESLHRRIDTYTLESALLSALSFSSFFSVVLSERNYINDLTQLFQDPLPRASLPSGLRLPLIGQIESYPTLSLAYLHAHMVPIICLALLLCASTFLGVLVARLRFNDGYRDAESLLKVAERINEKEEQAIQRDDEEKAAVYLGTIDSLLRNATALERGLGITVTHMRFSRNAGIVFFILALVMCGFFFSDLVAAALAVLFGSFLLIGYYDRFLRRLQRQEVFGQGVLGSLLKPFRGSA
jgi:hypothetical protein